MKKKFKFLIKKSVFIERKIENRILKKVFHKVFHLYQNYIY